MLCFNHSDFIKHKPKKNFALFFRENEDDEVLNELKAAVVSSMLSIKKNKELYKIELGVDNTYHCKINTLKHRNNKIRATLGIKRHGTYDWPVAEVVNQLKLMDVDYVPEIVAYGYERDHLGFVRKIVIVTRFIEGAMNLKTLIENNKNRINEVVFLTFNMIKQHLEDGMLHLDLWLGNILVKSDLSSAWMIDVEYFRFGSKARMEDRLGFCLGYFYRHTLSLHMSEDDYSELLVSWAENALQSYDLKEIFLKAEHAMHTKIDRKDRFKMF